MGEMELARKMSLHAAQGTADRETFIAMGGTGEEFDKVDVNGDGILDMHEIQSIVKNRKPQQTAKQRRAQYLFDQQQKVARDRLKDGKKKVVAASELLRQQATNSTHKELSEKEFQTAHQGRMGANGDGLSGGGPINMQLALSAQSRPTPVRPSTPGTPVMMMLKSKHRNRSVLIGGINIDISGRKITINLSWFVAEKK